MKTIFSTNLEGSEDEGTDSSDTSEEESDDEEEMERQLQVNEVENVNENKLQGQELVEIIESQLLEKDEIECMRMYEEELAALRNRRNRRSEEEGTKTPSHRRVVADLVRH